MYKLFLLLSLNLLSLFGDQNIFREIDRIYKLSSFHNISFKIRGDVAPIVIQKTEDKTIQVAFERYLNNDPEIGIANKDMIFVKSGSLRGVGVLITLFKDSENIFPNPKYQIWLPALRKIRAISNPLDYSGFGVLEKSLLFETKLRKIDDEKISIIDEKFLDLSLKKAKFKVGRYSQDIPQNDEVISKNFYIIEATPKDRELWYSKRVSFVEKENLLEYQTLYFGKDGNLIETIYRDFLEIGDKFISNYRYSIDHKENIERVIFLPRKSIIVNNKKLDNSFWSETTLQKLKR
jgi:hypothetical protein